MTKKALIVVSFGTTYPLARCAIEKIETSLAERFKEYDFYRAFTSQMVIKKIKEQEGVTICTPDVLLDKLFEEGYEEIICQSLHIIQGIEFEKLQNSLKQKSALFKSVKLGKPLLEYKEDYQACVDLVIKNMPILANREALVLMGHGTEHFANAAYCQLERTFRACGYENIYVGTVEGFPEIDDVLNRLNKKEVDKVYLAPFMIVAGDHAQVDLAGDEEDSWKSLIEKASYKAEVILKGLGEYEGMEEIFLRHLEEAKVL